jgi:hypothetical protein
MTRGISKPTQIKYDRMTGTQKKTNKRIDREGTASREVISKETRREFPGLIGTALGDDGMYHRTYQMPNTYDSPYLLLSKARLSRPLKPGQASGASLPDNRMYYTSTKSAVRAIERGKRHILVLKSSSALADTWEYNE